MASNTAEKVRLDKLLFERGLVESREKAKALILAGNVLVNEQVVDKAGSLIKHDDRVSLKERMKYVSRGGLKLEHALNEFTLDVNDTIAMDVGASTGGFTDCLLQNGAAKVYAVDVGYGQFDLKLRNDRRVVLFEKTNIRHLERDAIKDRIDIAVIDVSFISLLIVIPKVLEFLKERAEIIALIKPQFEVGRKDVGKGGVVKDEEKRRAAVDKIKSESEKMGLAVDGITESPIKGPKGNVEYLIYLRKTD
jgi:23S rRNA (cytidine1920-2'-O)/16S rRNA (cytidine1409-2'-O)-methyltransferase